MAKEQFVTAGKNDGRLYRAIICRDRETVLEELRAGDINPNMTIDGKSVLQCAGERGFKDIPRLLIKYSANMSLTYGKQNRSLPHFAVATGNYGFASLLLECGAKRSPRTANQSTPLHFAARTNQEYMVNALVHYQADISAKDNVGRTAADLALRNGYTILARKLVQAMNHKSERSQITRAGKGVAAPIAIEFRS